jgi:hypothetical protein
MGLKLTSLLNLVPIPGIMEMYVFCTARLFGLLLAKFV